MKKPARKLELRTQTIHQLTAAALEAIGGAQLPTTTHPTALSCKSCKSEC